MSLHESYAYREAMASTCSPDVVSAVDAFVAKHGVPPSPTLKEIQQQMLDIEREESAAKLRAELERELRRSPSHVRTLEAEQATAREVLAWRAEAEAECRRLGLPEVGTGVADRVLRIQAACKRLWPEHWTVLEACLAASVSLALRDVGEGLGLVLYGKSSDGKTTILEWLQGAEKTLWRTKITPAALTSGAADQKKERLQANAFVRTARHKVVLIGDLNAMVKANDDRVSSGYADFAIWLDGNGFTNEYGPHGTIGEFGDFTFVLLGAKTPMKERLWSELAQLGMRLLYVRVNKYSGTVGQPDFERMKRVMRHVCTEYLDWFFTSHEMRSQAWPVATDEQRARIKRASKRVEIAQQREKGTRQGGGHVHRRLSILAHARAVMYGRQALDDGDIALAEEVAAASAWSRRGYVLRAIDQGAKYIPQIAEASGLSPERCYTLLKRMLDQGCVLQTGTGVAGDPFAWTVNEEDECVD